MRINNTLRVLVNTRNFVYSCREYADTHDELITNILYTICCTAIILGTLLVIGFIMTIIY
jgi:hypothetical protein